MQLKGKFKEESLDPFSNVLKGLNDFSTFAKENELICFRFYKDYLYISGNSPKNLEIAVTIKVTDLFYEDFVIKTKVKDNELIFLVYVYQLYDIFRNIGKNTQVTVELIEKNGIGILAFEQYCNLTEAFKKIECGIEIINPIFSGFSKRPQVTKNSVTVTCKLKKCCKILKAYTKIYTKKVTIDVVGNEKNCDIVFKTNCSISKHVTILRGNRVLRKGDNKQIPKSEYQQLQDSSSSEVANKPLTEKQKEIEENKEKGENKEKEEETQSQKNIKGEKKKNNQYNKYEEEEEEKEEKEEKEKEEKEKEQLDDDLKNENLVRKKRKREQIKQEETIDSDESYNSDGNKIHVSRVLYKKKLLAALMILNDCRNNKEESGIFKFTIPYTKCWIALNLSKFETSGSWEVEVIVTDVYV